LLVGSDSQLLEGTLLDLSDSFLRDIEYLADLAE
jgi:hypothetical protein